jgi:predicted anti-sigma-YlaC factor YlaD
VECKETIRRLVELVEGELDSKTEARVRNHLQGCRNCRAEFELLRCASEALRQAAYEMAPVERYATPARIDRLMAAHSAAQRRPRLITFRRLVACAAAAVIAVCVPYIVGDLRRLGTAEPAPEIYVPVVLAAVAHGEPLREIRPLTVSLPAAPQRVPADWSPRLVRLDPPVVRVPVDHAFYDPEECCRWW